MYVLNEMEVCFLSTVVFIDVSVHSVIILYLYAGSAVLPTHYLISRRYTILGDDEMGFVRSEYIRCVRYQSSLDANLTLNGSCAPFSNWPSTVGTMTNAASLLIFWDSGVGKNSKFPTSSTANT